MTCQEQHIRPPAEDAVRLVWKPASRPARALLTIGCRCADDLYELGKDGDRYVITKTALSTGTTVVLQPEGESELLATWLNILNGTAI